MQNTKQHQQNPHSHSHSQNNSHGHHGHNHSHYSEKKILIVFFLNLFLAIFELYGGLLTNSTAIMSDALHDFGDSIALGIGYFLERLSKKKSDRLFSFGYRRFSLLGALLSSVILILGSVFILSEVVPRLLNPESVDHKGMLLFALVGIIVNGFSFWYLNKGDSANEKVLSLHMLEDLLGWAAVLIVSVVLFFKNLPILDPILSIVITSVILVNVYKNLKNIFYIFLQGAPKTISKENVEKSFLVNTKIDKVFHTHIWTLDGQKHILTTHVILKEGSQLQDYQEVSKWLNLKAKELGIWHSTIEIEF